MKVLKTYQRTYEGMGHVKWTDGTEQPAFVSFIDGKLAILRLDSDKRDEATDEFRLYEPKEQERLRKSDITEIHFQIPAHVKL